MSAMSAVNDRIIELGHRETGLIEIPFMRHCRIERVDAPTGTVQFVVDAAPPLTNTRGYAHGGLLMTMLDLALGHAALAAVEGASSFATIDMQTAFLQPGAGQIVAEGRVLRGGRSIVFCEGDIRDAHGDMLARASGVFKPLFPK
jgi:uncharacterized protein (TIGR00369 family)